VAPHSLRCGGKISLPEKNVLILHNYWSSVCSQKARLCLAEKGLKYENRHVNLFEFEHWTPEFLKINPKAVVPALDHDGRIVIESNVILEYLEDAFPQTRLRPEDPYARSQMRLWVFNSEEMAHENVNTASYNPRHATRHKAKGHTKEDLRKLAARCPNPILRNRLLHRFEHGVSEEQENEAYAALDYLLDQMDGVLAEGPWIAGREYSLADIAMAPYVNRIEVLKRPEMVSAARRPRLANWWMRMQARPAYQEAFSVANPDKSDPLSR
jgi:glutathione S-transferase